MPGTGPHENPNHQHGSVPRVGCYIDELRALNYGTHGHKTQLLLNVAWFGGYLCQVWAYTTKYCTHLYGSMLYYPYNL